MSQRSETGNLIVKFGLFLMVVAVLLWLRDPSRSIIAILIEVGVLILPAAAAMLTPLLTYLLILLFRRFFPSRKIVPVVDPGINPEDAGKWQLIGTGLFFVGWPIGVMFSLWLINGFAAWYFLQLPAVYVAPIDNSYWWIVAMFAGAVFGSIFSILIVKALLKSRYEVLSGHYDQAMGFDNQKVGKLILAGAFLLLSAMMFVGLNSYTRFTEEGIRTRRPDSLPEEFHAYDEIVAVRQVIRTNQSREDQVFIIEYADGKFWRSAPVESSRVPANYLSIMEYVAHQSGQELVRVVEFPISGTRPEE